MSDIRPLKEIYGVTCNPKSWELQLILPINMDADVNRTLMNVINSFPRWIAGKVRFRPITHHTIELAGNEYRVFETGPEQQQQQQPSTRQ